MKEDITLNVSEESLLRSAKIRVSAEDFDISEFSNWEWVRDDTPTPVYPIMPIVRENQNSR